MKKTIIFLVVLISIQLNFGQNNPGWQDISIDGNQIQLPWPNTNRLQVLSPDIVYVMGYGNLLLKTIDGGQNWSAFDTGFSFGFTDMAFATLNHGFIVGGQGQLIQTDDGGQTWTEINLGTTEFFNKIYIKSSDLLGDDLWIVGSNGTLWHFDPGVLQWAQIALPTTKNLYDIGFVDAQTGFIIGEEGLLLKTSNGGNTWNSIDLNTSDDFWDLNIDQNHISFIGGLKDDWSNMGGYLVTSDDGQNFLTHNLNIDLPIGLGAITSKNNIDFILGSACAVCDCALLRTFIYDEPQDLANISLEVDGGSDLGVSCENRGDIVAYDDQVIYIMSDYRIYKTTDGGSYTHLNIETYQNDLLKIYPNPTSDILEIKSEKPFSKIEIYTITGRKVFDKTFNNDFTHQRINLENLTKGIYFIKIAGTKYQALKKLTIK